VQSRKFKETISHIILVLHILVCTKWIVYLDLWWNIGYLQGPPRDGAYGYVPLNIPPRAPSRTPRLNNIQIYIEIYCYSTTDTKGQCFWRCPAYIAVTFHLVSEAEKQDIKGKEKKIYLQCFLKNTPKCVSILWFSQLQIHSNFSIYQYIHRPKRWKIQYQHQFIESKWPKWSVFFIIRLLFNGAIMMKKFESFDRIVCVYEWR
jgi:hypothetical protein